MTKVGERVGAIFGSNEDGSISFFGYGVYEGDFVPEEAVGWMADALCHVGATNPRIRLDSGKAVYGCECWWGSENAVTKRLDGAVIVEMDIEEVRHSHEPRTPGAPHG